MTHIALSPRYSPFQWLSWGACGEDPIGAMHALREGPDLDILTTAPYTLLEKCFLLGPDLVPELVQMISPPRRTWDFLSRLWAAYTNCVAYTHWKIFWMCLSQSQLDEACLVRETSGNEAVVRYDSLVGRLAEVMTVHWENHFQYPDFSGWRVLFQAAVRLDGLRVAIQHGCISPMLVYLRAGGPKCPESIYRSNTWTDLSSERLTHRLRHWAREVRAAGQDLEEYGQWEHRHLFSEGRNFELWQWAFDGCIACGTCVTFRVVNFTYGADANDWQIWMSSSSDERVGDFLEGLEEEYAIQDLPGMWPEATCQCQAEDTQDTWSRGIQNFWLSRRRRRRLRRYFGLTKEDFDNAYNSNVKEIVADEVERGKKRKARQEQFFKEADITPIPDPPY